jgi:hypothetical protein
VGKQYNFIGGFESHSFGTSPSHIVEFRRFYAESHKKRCHLLYFRFGGMTILNIITLSTTRATL